MRLTIGLLLLSLFPAFPAAASDVAPPACDERFDYAIFTIREDAWPKATTIAFSMYGYVLFYEGQGDGRYKQYQYTADDETLMKVNQLIGCGQGLLAITSGSGSKSERPVVSLMASYTSPRRIQKGRSVFAAEADQATELLALLNGIRDSILAEWNYGAASEEGKGHGPESYLETPDTNYISAYLAALHRHRLSPEGAGE